MRIIHTIALLSGLWLGSQPAWAGGVAVVDFQQAINEVADGERARTELQALEEQKQNEINALEQQLAAKEQQFNSEFSTYQSQVQMNILTPEARAQKEQQLGQLQNEYMTLQQQYQQTGMQAEMELQQTYAEKMDAIITKMRTVSEAIAQERGLDMVYEVTESGLVYIGPNVTDITPELIQRYNGN